MSSFKQNFTAFLTAAYDGSKKDFSQVEELYNASFHDEYVQLNGNTLTKAQMKQLHKNCMALSSTVSNISIYQEAEPSNRVEFQFRVSNDNFSVLIHEMGELKDGKLAKGKSLLDKSALAEMINARNYLLFEDNLRTLLTVVYDGKPKEDFSKYEHLYDAVFHEEYVQTLGGNLTRADMKHLWNNVASMGSLVSEIEINQIFPSNSVEYKWRVSNDKFNVIVHEVGELKDGKLVGSVSWLNDKESYDEMLKARSYLHETYEVETLINNLHEYEKVLNDPKSTEQDVQRMFDTLFHDDFQAKLKGGGFGHVDAEELNGKTLNKSDIAQIKEEFVEDADKAFAFNYINIVDNRRVEIVVSDDDKWRRHQILTSQNGKIISIESVQNSVHDLVHNLNKYIRIQNSNESTLEDVKKVFEMNFHDDCVLQVEGYEGDLTKEDARAIVYKDFIDQAELKFEMIEVLDDAHIEVIISKKGDWRRHQVLSVKDGKIIGITTVTADDTKDYVTADGSKVSFVSRKDSELSAH